MAFTGNGLQLTTKMLKELASGAIVMTMDGATGAITIGAQYDNTTVKVNDSNQLTVGAIPISSVTSLQTNLTDLSDRIDALEAGTIDLSAYTNANGLSIRTTQNGGDGGFVSDGTSASIVTASGTLKVTDTAVTFNDSAVLLASDKNVANGIAGLDANSKLTASQVPVGEGLEVSGSAVVVSAATATTLGGVKVAAAATSGLTLAADGGLTVDKSQFILQTEKGAANGVAPLNANGTIDRQYLDTLNIQEVYSATVSTAGAITIGADQAITSAADVQIGDAITLTAAVTVDGKAYKEGDMFRRITDTDDTLADYAYLSMDLFAATSAEVTAGTDQEKYITPAALKGSAPSFDGSNITNINVANIAKATDTTFGVVQIPSANGISVADGVVALAQASKSAFGTVKVGDNINVAAGVISVPAASDTVAGVVTLGTAEGNVPVIDADGKIKTSLIALKANSGLTNNSGTGLSVMLGTGLGFAADGKINVTYSYTLPAATSSELGGVTIADDSAISNTAGAIDVKVDGVTINKDTNNQLQIVDSYVQETATTAAQDVVKTTLAPIDITAGNFTEGKVTVSAKAVPKGIIKKTTPFTFFGVSPDTVTYADGTFTSVLDLTGLTVVNTTDWQVVF